MKLIGFDDYDWEPDGYFCAVPGDSLPRVTITPTIINRPGATATFGPSVVGERTIAAEFGYTGASEIEAAYDALYSRLRPLDLTPRQLRIERNDGTLVAIDAVISFPPPADTGLGVVLMPVNFTTVDAAMTALSPSSMSKTIADSRDQALSVPIAGDVAGVPTISLQPTGQRASGTSTVGWTKRQILRITNNASAPMERYAYALSLGDTSALVSAGKALASGNDLRIIRNGVELPRTLVGWNTANTLAWIVIDRLPAGGTFDVEVWYGNPQAGAPTVLSGNDYPAFDPATSTNALLKYPVARTASNAGKGGWPLSSGTTLPTIVTDAPGAWQFATTKPGTSDDLAQSKYSTYVDTNTYYQARFDAVRARANALTLDPSQVDADGVQLTNPLGITNVRADIEWQNELASGNSSNPIGRVVVLQSSNGTDWEAIGTLSAEQDAFAVQAAANYATSGNPTHVAFAVWPSGNEITKKAKDDRQVAGRWYSVLEVSINSALAPQTTIQSEQTIYEFATTLQLGGDLTPKTPYTRLYLGGSASRRYAVPLNDIVTIDLEKRTATRYASDGVTVVATVPLAAIAAYDNDGSGERTAAQWLPLKGYVNPLPNHDFDASNIDGWTWYETGSGIGASTVGPDTGVYSTAPASMHHAITGSALAAGNDAIGVRADTVLPIGGRSVIQVAADVRSTTGNLSPVLGVQWLNAAGAEISVAKAADWTPAANTWTRRVAAFVPPAGAVSYRVLAITRALVANATGTTYFDRFTTNGNELLVSAVSPGTVVVSAAWTPQYP